MRRSSGRWRSLSISVIVRPRNLPTKFKTCREATRCVVWWKEPITPTAKPLSCQRLYYLSFQKLFCVFFISHPLCFAWYQVAFQHFQELDEHISYVATKVCHLGDQLEGVNTPRQRAVEAQRLMTYFNEFLDGDLRSDVFNNPDKVSMLHMFFPFTSVEVCMRDHCRGPPAVILLEVRMNRITR